jgi:hypothetical protein
MSGRLIMIFTAPYGKKYKLAASGGSIEKIKAYPGVLALLS